MSTLEIAGVGELLVFLPELGREVALPRRLPALPQFAASAPPRNRAARFGWSGSGLDPGRLVSLAIKFPTEEKAVLLKAKIANVNQRIVHLAVEQRLNVFPLSWRVTTMKFFFEGHSQKSPVRHCGSQSDAHIV